MKKRLITISAIVALLCMTFVITVFAVSAQNENEKNLGYTPSVTVDYGNYSKDDIPSAIKEVPYKIFSADAEDVYGNELAVNAKVYIHYLEPNKSLVTLDDGYAMPKYYGTYTVEYSARDKFGNVGYATYDFTCADLEKLSLTLSGEYTQTVAVGNEATIKGYSFENNIGEVAVTITAINENGEKEDLTGKTSFVPFYTGNYAIVYECKDYNLTATQSYVLTVTENGNSIIAVEPTLLKYYIVGKKYSLPTAECYSFASGAPVVVEPMISVKYGDGEYQEVTDTFTAAAAGDITFKYSVTGDSKEYSAKAIDVGVNGSLNLTKYFYSDSAVASAQPDRITYEVKNDGESIDFINLVESHEFDFIFSIPSGYNNFSTLNLFLTSSVDSDKSLKISYAKSGDASTVTINDEFSYKCDESFAYASSITVNYIDDDNVLNFGSLKISLDKFEGFSNEKVYFSFSLEGINGKSGIDVIKIVNQIFSDSAVDEVAPKVYFDTYSNGVETIGNTIIVERIYVFDVLDTDFTVAYSIKSPSGNYVVDVNGVTLNGANASYEKQYSFVGNEYGKYVVTMYVCDSSDNEETYAYSITVADVEGPTVSLKSELKSNLKIGEAFKVCELNVTDDKSEKFEISAYIVKPSMMTETVEIGKSYSFSKKGQYVLGYVVRDESGNSTILLHTFIVE